MRHLIICREYPPAPGGGIGTYAFLISHLLAEFGETVHVISQIWEGAEKTIQEECNGRLIIHRIPFENWTALRKPRPHPDLRSNISRTLFNSEFHAQGFSWEAGQLAERLVDSEGIDLIESQEYEAPLYFFLLRRALGSGPKHSPPCIVHLHSPTVFIATHNDWDLTSSAISVARRQEEYCIAAADALLCPSSFLASQVQAHYGVEPGMIEVIPLPKAAGGRIERAADTWINGPICYVGRLERRKGALEWIRAAVQIAQESPQTVFEFTGENILGCNPIQSELVLIEMVPSNLRPRFTFHGGQTRQSIPEYLARARMTAVPSRWENFPYACIEAMSSGLPVLATRQGGMPEMIQDGHTGWLADQPTSEHLAQTLRRALETPPARMAEMGRQASDEIEQICNPSLILEKQIEFRNRIARHPAARSLSYPLLDRLQGDGWRNGTINEVLVERSGWLFSSLINHGKRRTLKGSLKLIDVFNLASKNPAFFFEKAVWAIRQVSKKFQMRRIDALEAQLEPSSSLYGRKLISSWLERWSGRVETGGKEGSPYD